MTLPEPKGYTDDGSCPSCNYDGHSKVRDGEVQVVFCKNCGSALEIIELEEEQEETNEQQ